MTPPRNETYIGTEEDRSMRITSRICDTSGVLLVTREVPVVASQVIVSIPTPSYDDRGLAIAAVHSCLERTERFPSGILPELLARFTVQNPESPAYRIHQDRTDFYFTCTNAEQVAVLLPVIFDGLFRPLLDDWTLEERCVRLSKKSFQPEGKAFEDCSMEFSNPRNIIQAASGRNLYHEDSTYAHNPGGTRIEMLELTNEALKDYIETYYRPEYAKFIITLDKWSDDLEKTFRSESEKFDKTGIRPESFKVSHIRDGCRRKKIDRSVKQVTTSYMDADPLGLLNGAVIWHGPRWHDQTEHMAMEILLEALKSPKSPVVKMLRSVGEYEGLSDKLETNFVPGQCVGFQFYDVPSNIKLDFALNRIGGVMSELLNDRDISGKMEAIRLQKEVDLEYCEKLHSFRMTEMLDFINLNSWPVANESKQSKILDSDIQDFLKPIKLLTAMKSWNQQSWLTFIRKMFIDSRPLHILCVPMGLSIAEEDKDFQRAVNVILNQNSYRTHHAELHQNLYDRKEKILNVIEDENTDHVKDRYLTKTEFELYESLRRTSALKPCSTAERSNVYSLCSSCPRERNIPEDIKRQVWYLIVRSWVNDTPFNTTLTNLSGSVLCEVKFGINVHQSLVGGVDSKLLLIMREMLLNTGTTPLTDGERSRSEEVVQRDLARHTFGATAQFELVGGEEHLFVSAKCLPIHVQHVSATLTQCLIVPDITDDAISEAVLKMQNKMHSASADDFGKNMINFLSYDNNDVVLNGDNALIFAPVVKKYGKRTNTSVKDLKSIWAKVLNGQPTALTPAIESGSSGTKGTSESVFHYVLVGDICEIFTKHNPVYKEEIPEYDEGNEDWTKPHLLEQTANKHGIMIPHLPTKLAQQIHVRQLCTALDSTPQIFRLARQGISGPETGRRARNSMSMLNVGHLGSMVMRTSASFDGDVPPGPSRMRRRPNRLGRCLAISGTSWTHYSLYLNCSYSEDINLKIPLYAAVLIVWFYIEKRLREILYRGRPSVSINIDRIRPVVLIVFKHLESTVLPCSAIKIVMNEIYEMKQKNRLSEVVERGRGRATGFVLAGVNTASDAARTELDGMWSGRPPLHSDALLKSINECQPADVDSAVSLVIRKSLLSNEYSRFALLLGPKNIKEVIRDELSHEWPKERISSSTGEFTLPAAMKTITLESFKSSSLS